MDDIDLVVVSGVIVENPDWQETTTGKVALNFVVESKKTIGNEAKYFKHQITLWDKMAEKYRSKIQNGAYVRIEGHLQATVLNFFDAEGKPKTYYCDRVNAKFIAFDAE